MNKRLPFAEVNAAALAALPRVLDWAGVRHQHAGHEVQMINPTRGNDDGYGSFSINSHTGVWGEFATGDKGGDVVSLVAYIKQYGQGEACKDLARLLGIASGEASPAMTPAPLPTPPADSWQPLLPIPADMMGSMPRHPHKHIGKAVAFWHYRDAAGLPLAVVVRVEPGRNERSKDYFPLSVWQDKETGKRAWRWKNLPAPRPLYGLDRLVERPNAPVVVCEGEKAADAAAKLLPDHVAVCWMNGAEALGKADFSPLTGRDCLVWRDNDVPGEAAQQQLAKILGNVGAASVAQIGMSAFSTLSPAGNAQAPDLVAGGRWHDGDDAADALAYGWTAAHIALLQEAGKLLDLTLPEPVHAAPDALAPDSKSGNTAPADQTKAAPPTTSKAKKNAPKRPQGGGSAGSPFRVTDSGVWFQTEDMDAPLWICRKLDIIARTRDKVGDNWGLLVRFADPDGTEKEWNIPSELLAASEGAEVVKGLMSRGLLMGAGPKAKQRLLEYLCRYDGNDRATIVNRLGWHDGAFLLPNSQLGDSAESLVFQASNKQRDVMQSAGTLEDWQQQVARYCVGNSRLAFAVSVAFAGPLLNVIGGESGGFHFYGDSSQGKTTLLQVAASVFGTPDYLQTWRATDNAIEAIAAAYSDCLLPLDEIHQCDPRIIGETVYMLGNGRGKTRANDRGGSRGNVAEWRLLFLSSGEKTLAAHMAEARKEMKAGMEIRMLAVQADAGQSLGLFDDLHDKSSGKALADHLKASIAKYHGTPSSAYIGRVVAERGQLGAAIRKQLTRFCDEVLPGNAHGQAHRAASRFALVAVAGELASMWGVTGWPQGTAWSAAKVCFADWIKSRGTTGNREDADMLAKLRLFFEQNGEARFTRLSVETPLHEQDGQATDPDDHAPKTINRCGYRFKDKISGLIKFYVLAESFRNEVCAGMDVGRACKLLQAAGALEVTKGAGYMLQVRTTPEARYSTSGRAKVYCITSNLFDAAGDKQPEASA